MANAAFTTGSHTFVRWTRAMWIPPPPAPWSIYAFIASEHAWFYVHARATVPPLPKQLLAALAHLHAGYNLFGSSFPAALLLRKQGGGCWSKPFSLVM